MPAFSQSRDRGRILTPEALARLEQAIQQWQQQNDKRLTYEGWKGLTSSSTFDGLDPATLRKIREGKVKVAPKSIRIALESLGLTLQESDLISSLPAVGASSPDPNFVGRDKVLSAIDKLFEQHRLVLVQGEGGLGKSTVARFYSRKFEPHADFYKLGTVNSSEVANAESLVDRWLQEFFSEEPSRQEFSIKLARLRKYLEKDDRRICFVLDNLEPALVNGKFKPENNRYVDLLEVLSDPLVRSRTLITSREPINESGIKICIYPLPELDVNSWYEYFQIYQIQINEESLTDPNSAINQIHKAYGGNAECMSVLTGDIVNSIEYSKDLEAYWLANREDLLNHPTIETLIQRQFEVLRENNPLAYQLLCRMGCYRYQDAVATVPEEGIIALLWEDEAKPRAKRTLKDLRDRCLIKFFEQEQEKGYFLHPVMRAESVSRLKNNCEHWTEEGKQANRKAAEFWTEHIKTVETADDALKAFEAYYHYFIIQNFEQAASIILIIRQTDNDILHLVTSSLSSSFIILGLYEPIKRAISQVITTIKSAYILSNLYKSLGDLMNYQGNLKKAIHYHKKSGEYAKILLSSHAISSANREVIFRTKLLSFIYLFNIGICMADLWETEKAISYLEQACDLFKENMLHSYEIRGWSNLASIYSSIGNTEKAHFLAQLIAEEITTVRLGIRSTGYRFYHLAKTYQNLGDFERSLTMYTNAYEYAEQTNFKQLLGIVDSGLANLYKQLSDYEKAIEYHTNSLLILKKINDIPSLAEASFLFGLTYQAMGKYDLAKEYKAKALKLFAQMAAPRQIERVNQAFQSL